MLDHRNRMASRHILAIQDQMKFEHQAIGQADAKTWS
jgi:Tfp pilus assembly ATPase PilU